MPQHQPQKKTAETKPTEAAPKPAQLTSTRAPVWTGALGNQPALSLQPKLTVNQPGDEYEVEADRVAAQVMCMASPAVTQVQRCACGGIAGPDGECDACKAKRLQRKADGISHTEAPPSVHQTLHSSGQPLDTTTRAFMEPRFGQDFSDVRVHTDSQAAQSAADVSARAYTVGNNVVFGAGRYAPETDSGKHLLAHELTHTVQQSIKNNLRRADTYLSTSDNKIASRALTLGRGRGSVLQRQPETWYRGEAEGVLPSQPGSVIHDFGDGLYLTNDPNVASQYASLRAGSNPSAGKVLSTSFERSLLGRVLDLTKDPRWASYLNRRIGGQTIEQIIRLANENYGRLFEAFLKENKLNIADYDTVIGQEFVRGGNQICVRNPSIQAQIRSQLVPTSVAPDCAKPPSETNAPKVTEYNVKTNYRVLGSQEVPGNRFVYEVEAILGDGLTQLNEAVQLQGTRPLPAKIILRITTDAKGAFVAAESSTGEVGGLIEALAQKALQSAPVEAAAAEAGSGVAGATRGASKLVRGVAWVGLAVFAAVSIYRLATTDNRWRESVKIAGGAAAGAGATYLVCNLILGIETLGWSLLICGLPAGAAGAVAGEAAAQVAYEEATINKTEIRSWVKNQNLQSVSTTERLRLIFSLMKGWVGNDDITAIKQLLDSVQTANEMNIIKRFLEPMLLELTSIGQRTQIRVSLARRF